jgi:hypothetical protein
LNGRRSIGRDEDILGGRVWDRDLAFMVNPPAGELVYTGRRR